MSTENLNLIKLGTLTLTLKYSKAIKKPLQFSQKHIAAKFKFVTRNYCDILIYITEKQFHLITTSKCSSNTPFS
ncbi:unnamed protein product [Schistosoma intercalatum]|nr:unnamed protein product [Schistosoma intercalatum]